MGLGVRIWCCWQLLLALINIPGYECTGDGALVRIRRQSDWWRNYQRVVPAQSQGSSRGGSRGLDLGAHGVYGFGASRGGSRWGAPGGRAGAMLRQQPPTVGSPSSPVNVKCEEDSMMVSVMVDFYGTGKLVKPSDLSLGPQGCKPNTQSADNVIFQISLQDCGNTVQMTQDWVIYESSLTYSPTSSIPIIRTNPAVVPIMCYYYSQRLRTQKEDLGEQVSHLSGDIAVLEGFVLRHANVSSKAIEPTWVPFSTTVTSEERLSFSLRLMTADWSGPRSSPIYQLGDILYIEASVDTQNHVGLILYIDQCVTTISPDPTSAPSYGIIENNGCLVDGIQDDSSSAFIAPRVKSDKLQFTVDAFRFLGNYASLIYITCYLKAAAATQGPDAMNKACSYNKATQSWSAVEGSSNICQCCGTGTCSNPASVGGGRPRFGRPRAFGKRGASDEPHTEEGQTVTTLGPLFVIGPKERDVSAAVMKEDSASVELWVWVAVGCLGLLVLLVCAVFIGTSLKKPQFVLSVQK